MVGGGGNEPLGDQTGLRKYKRDRDPTNHITDSIERPIHEPLGCPSLKSPNWLMGTPNILHASSVYPVSINASLCMLLMLQEQALADS